MVQDGSRAGYNVGNDLDRINVASTLSEAIEGRLDESDRRRVQGVVRDLKLNYVQKSKEGT